MVAADPPPLGPGSALLGVFDGHRGAAAAHYLAAHLGAHLAERSHDTPSAAAALAAALADADAAFRAGQAADHAHRVARMGAAAAGPPPVDGATAAVALVYAAGGDGGGGGQQQQQQQRLALANLGDSRAVLCRGGRAVQLLADQTAERADERARVAAAGGEVSVRAGGWRVGAAGLAVTRSVGDADAKAQGVSAVAETADTALGEGDTFLILATDGLWDRLGCAQGRVGGRGEAVGGWAGKGRESCSRRRGTDPPPPPPPPSPVPWLQQRRGRGAGARHCQAARHERAAAGDRGARARQRRQCDLRGGVFGGGGQRRRARLPRGSAQVPPPPSWRGGWGGALLSGVVVNV